MKKLFTVLLTCLCLGVMGQYHINTSFEDGDRTAGSDIIYNSGLACTSDCMEVITDTKARLGSKVIRSIVYPTSPCTCGNSIRCEGLESKTGTDTLQNYSFYAASIYPVNYHSPIDVQNELIFQWKTTSTSPQDPSPVLAVWIRNIGGVPRLRFVVTVDTVNANQSAPFQREFDMSVLDLRQWSDLVFNINWQDNHTGFLKFYKNKTLVYTYNGATTNKFYNSGSKGYDPFRFGIYKFPYCQAPGSINTTSKEMLFDVLRIGTGVVEDYFINDVVAPPPVPAGEAIKIPYKIITN